MRLTAGVVEMYREVFFHSFIVKTMTCACVVSVSIHFPDVAVGVNTRIGFFLISFKRV